MLVRQAKSVAEEWVHHEGSKLAGLQGAYLAGSVTTLPDWAHLPETSDVDVTVVMEDPPSKKSGKFKYRDLLLEVSFEERDTIQSAENVLGHPHLAGGIRSMHIVSIPLVTLGDCRRKWPAGILADGGWGNGVRRLLPRLKGCSNHWKNRRRCTVRWLHGCLEQA